MSEKFSRSNAAGRRQVHRLQPCIMRSTRQSADLCLRAPTGCCRIRKQVGAILKLFKCWKSSLVLRVASIRSQLASSCLALDDGMPELAPTGGRHWPANGVSGGTRSVTMSAVFEAQQIVCCMLLLPQHTRAGHMTGNALCNLERPPLRQNRLSR